jgi:hypothetical protein
MMNRSVVRCRTRMLCSSIVLLIVCLSGYLVAQTTATVTVLQPAPVRLRFMWSSVPGASSYQLLVDDTPTFLHPLLSQTVSQTSLFMNDAYDFGFAPGVTYYVRVQPSGEQTTFRLNFAPWSESYLTYAYAKNAWNYIGRMMMADYGGVQWNSTTGGWQLNPSWSYAPNLTAQQVYNVELPARAAIQMGLVRHDLALLDEVARYYLAFEPRFTTLGAMRALVASGMDTSLLNGHGPDTTRTFNWVYQTSRGSVVRECELCNSQFLHPVARLIRIITTLPASERTSSMLAFVSYYGPLIIQDHLLRQLYNGELYDGEQLVSYWQQILSGSRQAYMTDRHVWTIAATAEILGANANAPTLVPLSTTDQARLKQAVQVGVELFQKERTYYPNTQNFQGLVVGSASYFNGDFDQTPSYAYTGYEGATYPTPADASINPGTSWDISHFYRVPVFLRSLYDNRKATGLNFPLVHDIQLLDYQFMYKAFQGNMQLPLFNNFFEGSNGWFNLGVMGSSTGYPPVQYCYAQSSSKYPCLIPGAIQGWGLLAFSSVDLTTLQHSLATMAWSQDPQVIAFRNRYYIHSTQLYQAIDAAGKPYYPDSLLYVLAGTAERLR